MAIARTTRMRARRVAAWAMLAAVFVALPAHAQTPPKSAGPVDAAILEDMVAASRILADQGVVDGFGHVSMRHPKDPNRYLMAKGIAPELVTAADILEYDLDSNAIDLNGRKVFLERFIHGELYKARGDVNAVIHGHSPSVIPFGISTHPLKPVYHMSGFLGAGVPNFDIRTEAGMTNMLISSIALGQALAKALGDKPVALMRGHGNVVVGPNIKYAVYRAVYTEANARLQLQAETLGGPLVFLTPEEGKKADDAIMTQIDRPWELWRKKAGVGVGK